MALSSSQIASIASEARALGAGKTIPTDRAIAVIVDIFAKNPETYPIVRTDFESVVRTIWTDRLPKRDYFDRLVEETSPGVYVKTGEPSVSPERAPRPPRVSKSEGLSWSPSFLSPDSERESWYGEDAGLRRLALTQTKCFSAYSEGDKACGACPLARFCQEASLAKMDELARLLDQQEEARLQEEAKKLADAAAWEAMNAPGTAPVSPEAPVAPVAPKAPSSTASVASVLESLMNKGMTATSPPMPFKGVCSSCSSAIEAGSSVIHVRGRGMYHLDCAQNL